MYNYIVMNTVVIVNNINLGLYVFNMWLYKLLRI